MYMNKILSISALLLASAFIMTSCSDDNEELVPLPQELNYFEMPDPTSSFTTELRQNFYKEFGIYLLFNDTLYVGKDNNNYNHIETVDLSWSPNSYSTLIFTIDYFKTDNQRKNATDKIKKYIIPHINGSKLKPFSILALADIQGLYDSPKFINNFRCLAINAALFVDADSDAARMAVAADILSEYVSNYIPDSNSPQILEYRNASSDLFNVNILNFIPDWNDNPDMARLYDFGFISHATWGAWTNNVTNDINDFLKTMLKMSPDEFKAIYGAYPNVMTKYNVLYNIFSEMGFKF